MKFVKVLENKKEPYDGYIYDLDVNNSHTYNVEKIIVGNCSSGLHGVGATCVNALSDNFDVIVKRNGNIYHQTFQYGNPITKVDIIGKSDQTGTTIKYHPDKKIFKITLEPSEKLEHRISELASLNPGVHIHYSNELTNMDKEYYFEDGIVGYVTKMIGTNARLYDNPFYITGKYELPDKQLILCDIAFIHDDEVEPNCKIKTFANNVNTYEGGFHLIGFKNAYKDIINQYGMDKKIIKEPIEMKYLMDGLYCIVSIKIPNAEFEGQTKTKLGNKEAQYAIETIMNDVFKKSVSNKENIPIFDAIVTRASKVKEAEEAARRARNISRQTKKINKIALPGKLAECGNKNGYRELFIVEGDSAAGCFVSSTKIRLADSRILTIAELVQEQNNGKQNYVFSIDNSGNFVVEPIKDVFKTKHVSKLCQVILDNDSILECTPDHPFMLQDMSYKQAKDLTMKDALMTVDIKENIHVISCNIIQKEEDVYDLSVPPYKNFILDAGVVVHNSAKEGRYREFQAILPLRGKILNVSKADIERILNSDVIKSLIASVGAGIGSKFNINDVRYDKIISMCFTGDTRVKLLNGTSPTFEELVKQEEQNPGQTYWTYSINGNGNVVPGEGHHPRITRYTSQIAIVTLDNGFKVKCTPDHLFMNRDGKYIEAKNLKRGDSLMSLYAKLCDNKAYNYGREEFLNPKDSKWIFTHHQVMNILNHKDNSHGWSIHHKNENKIDNTPTNLQWKPTKLHLSEHNRKKIIKYNKSLKRIMRIKQLHQDGVYTHTYFGNNGYNGSEEQKNMLKHLNQREDMKKMHSEIFSKYNKSEQNSLSTSKLNQREDVKIIQARNKIIHSVACVIRKQIPLNEKLFQNISLKSILTNVPSNDKICKYFDSYDELFKLAMEYEQNELTDEMFERLTNVEQMLNERKFQNIKTKRTQIAKVIKYLLENSLEFNETNYMKSKKIIAKKAPIYQSILNYFKTYEEAISTGKCYNHKVENVQIINYNKQIPMYDFTVNDYHNFAMNVTNDKNIDNVHSESIFVHQCDADVDGSHIRSLILTLFYYYMPGLIESGMVYSAQPPLYRIIKSDNTSLYLFDDSSLKEYQSKHKNEKYILGRFKGLGEMNPEQLCETTLDPKTRILRQITLDDAKDAAKSFEILMGKNAGLRRDFIDANSFKINIDDI